MGVGTPTRCIICGEDWNLDYDPPACTCPDGGVWQIKIHQGWVTENCDVKVIKEP
jgi:hypothetical protein